MKVIPVPKEPGDIRDMLDRGYDPQSINLSYKQDLEDIRREYSMMALLKGNANVVYCDDICDEPNPDGIGWKLYIRMELLTPLTKVVRNPASEEQVVKVGMDLCNALVACKKKNILHRDIKPANIMVAEDGNFKLGDFGVAKTSERTAGGTKTGTYNFMAPEVYNNQEYGFSVDIYSLGMVLYWMLNRRLGPFLPLPPVVPTASQTDEAQQRRFGGETLPPPVDGSQALKQIVLRACAFDPAIRYSHPEDLYADLAAYDTMVRAQGGYPENTDETPPASKPNATGGKGPGRDNIWSGEYDATIGSTHSGSTMGGGTVGGGTVGGGSGSHIGPFDIRGQLQLSAQELASGCKKPFTSGSGGTVTVTVPAGTKSGAVLCLTGAGKTDPATGARGNAYVTVTHAAILDELSDFWKKAAPKKETQSSRAGVITSAMARSGGIKTFKFKDGKTKTVQIPAGCKDGQVVDGVKVYVHDFSTKVGNMRDLPDAVLEMYASKSSGLVSGVLIAFVLWMIFGIATMMIPIMAVGLFVHVIVAVVRGLKKKQIIDEAANILKARQKRRV